MTRQVYVNGRYLPYRMARVHVEDRGFQFADSVYEVCEINDGRLVDITRHLTRLRRSLCELEIEFSMSDAALRHIMHQTVKRNLVRTGTLYMQVSRGWAKRDFLYPCSQVRPTLVCLARSALPGVMEKRAGEGISVVTQPDPRWQRCDIKTVMLLPAVLAKQKALEDGAQEVWFVDRDGNITEGASSTAWIITADGRVMTRPLGQEILPGVTRATVIDELAGLGLTLDERAFSVSEAEVAQEAFVTAASGTVLPVVRINKRNLGSGCPGSVTKNLRLRFHEFAELG